MPFLFSSRNGLLLALILYCLMLCLVALSSEAEKLREEIERLEEEKNLMCASLDNLHTSLNDMQEDR